VEEDKRFFLLEKAKPKISLLFKGAVSVISVTLHAKGQCPIYNGTLETFV